MGDFGDFIKNKRRELELTLADVSDKLNISFSYLSDMEQGKKLPPNSDKESHKELMKKIKDVYELSEEEYEKMQDYADRELMEKGHLQNDVKDYVMETPAAITALRKATRQNLSNSDWQEIIKKMEKKNGK